MSFLSSTLIPPNHQPTSFLPSRHPLALCQSLRGAGALQALTRWELVCVPDGLLGALHIQSRMFHSLVSLGCSCFSAEAASLAWHQWCCLACLTLFQSLAAPQPSPVSVTHSVLCCHLPGLPSLKHVSLVPVLPPQTLSLMLP